MLYTEILKDARVFARLYKKGFKASCPGVTAYFLRNNRPYNRFGITAGKKIGGAVERNRAKRILRAAYRKNELSVPLGCDIVFVAREEINGKKSTEFDRLFVKLERAVSEAPEKPSTAKKQEKRRNKPGTQQ